MDQELATLIEKAGSKKSSLELLAYMRAHKVRRPDLVLKYGVKLLNSSLGDEVWTIYEQVFMASLDLGEQEVANHALNALKKKFPGSSRVKRLAGLYEESEENYPRAEALYTELLAANPANTLALKRRAAVELARGRPAAAARALGDYLRDFPADVAAWEQLLAVHLGAGGLAGARFCLEELLLAEPGRPRHHRRLAELLYTQAQGEDARGAEALLRRARRHLCRALELAGPGAAAAPRAHLLLAMTCAALGGAARGAEARADREMNLALHEMGADAVRRAFNVPDCPEEIEQVTSKLLEDQAAALQAGGQN